MENFNAKNMKFYNRNSILNKIRDNKLSRADLSRETGLTRAAITIITSDLEKRGLIIEGEMSSECKKGRKSTLLSINGEKFCIIGINISRHEIVMGVVDFAGKALCRDEFVFEADYKREDALLFINEQIEKYFEIYKKEKFIGIGIATPGPVNSQAGMILNSPNFIQWNNFEIVNYFKDRYDIKVLLENNSNCITLYEKNYGIGKNLENFIGFVIDSGIGSSVIINNNIYNGKNGLGVELGHCSIDRNGKHCSCGNTGCVELYASVKNIIKEARLIDKSFINWKTIVDFALNGNEKAFLLIEQEAIYLSELMINSANSFDISDFIIFGELTYKPQILKEKLEKLINEKMLGRSVSTATVYFAEDCEWNSYIASANLIIRNYNDEN